MALTVHFIHLGDAYLPELAAYQEWLQSRQTQAVIHRQPDTVPADARFVWWMCGRVAPAQAARFARAWQVHEYASASVPPLAWPKDLLKRWTQARPSYRIFQNAWVRDRMGFADDVPHECRDMGLSTTVLQTAAPAAAPPAHDFVYLGEMRRLAGFLPLLGAIARSGRRLLLIGTLPPELAALQRQPGTTCTGRVPQSEVAALLRTARCGLNLVPRRAPFTQQTSTKLLEYCAAGLQVASTDYPWVRRFAQQHGAHISYLPARVASGAAATAALEHALQLPPALPLGALSDAAWPRVVARMAVWRHMGLMP